MLQNNNMPHFRHTHQSQLRRKAEIGKGANFYFIFGFEIITYDNFFI